MKLIFVTVAVLLCGASAHPSVFDGPQCKGPNGQGLTTTVRQVLDMVPLDKVIEIYLVAISNDAETQKVMEYVQSDSFVKMVSKVNNHANFQKLLKKSCDELFLDARYYMNKAHDYLGWPVIPANEKISNFATSGFHGMLEDILAVVPTKKIHALIKEKLETDEYVKKAVEIMRSAEFKQIVKDVTTMPEFKHIESELAEMGVQVEKIIGFLRKFFGWEI